MNLNDYERMAARVIDSEPASVTESSQVEQLVAACKNGKSLAVMDALFRFTVRELIREMSPGTDMHSSVLMIDSNAEYQMTEPETRVLRTLASYACGDPDHSYNALVEYHDSAASVAEAQVNLAALIRVAKAVHAGRITMKEH